MTVEKIFLEKTERVRLAQILKKHAIKTELTQGNINTKYDALNPFSPILLKK